MECSVTARLMFIGMWNFADDAGRMPFSPKTIKAQIFPSDDISVESVLGMLQELSENGLILIYTVDNKQYLQVTGWHHQRIDKPQKPKCPEPFLDNSENVQGTFVPGKKEREKEREGASPEEKIVPIRNFAFEGKTIRLDQNSFDRWEKSYYAISDFPAELQAADDYYTEHPPKDGKWFFPVSRWLQKKHTEQLQARRADEAW